MTAYIAYLTATQEQDITNIYLVLVTTAVSSSNNHAFIVPIIHYGSLNNSCSPNDRLVVATTSASCNRYIDHSLGIRNVHTFVFGQHAFWRQTSSLRKVIDRSRVLSTKKSPCRPTAYTKHTHHRRSSISVSLSELLISYAVISLNFLH